jgi:shikimate kinase
MNLALIGMPGCGKSTVGRHLARHLGLRFVDADTELEARIGMPIRAYFELHGEPAFRDEEEAVIEGLSHGQGLLIATGGGVVLRQANREALHARCKVFYMRATPEELFRRLRHDTHRPLGHLAVEQRHKPLRHRRAVLGVLRRERRERTGRVGCGLFGRAAHNQAHEWLDAAQLGDRGLIRRVLIRE